MEKTCEKTAPKPKPVLICGEFQFLKKILEKISKICRKGTKNWDRILH